MTRKHNKPGFTLIEVALFLALSGLIMVGIIVGANATISRQRYNDSVTNFAEYIRGIYEDVVNVSNDKDPSVTEQEAGRTKTAIYGKLLSFGECTTPTCQEISNKIYTYDIVGLAVSSASVKGSRVIDMLYNEVNAGGVYANIFDRTNCSGVTVCQNQFYRMSTYEIPWEGSAETSNGSKYRGAILIVRSPATGGVRTYTYTYTNNNYNFHLQTNDTGAYTNFASFLREVGHKNNNYGENELTLCVDSDDNSNSNRRGITISARATNTAGVGLNELDDENSPCLGRP